MKRALITGVTGQDGAYLAQLLLDKGYEVIGITRNNHFLNHANLDYLGITDRVTLEECDLTDLPFVLRILREYQPTELYNLAAQSSVGLSFQQPTSTIQYNVNSVLNLLEAIRITDTSIKFYQASSSEMFGKVPNLPINPETPMHPLSPYAISKATGFWTVVNFRESFNLFACNGILFNHESVLRPRNFFLKKVILDSFKLKNGTISSLSVGNLDVRRDFGFAPRYVEAMWLMLQQEQPRDFVICSGKSVLLRDIVQYIFSKLDLDPGRIKVDKNLYRPVDIYDIYGNNEPARTQLGWTYDLPFERVLDMIIDEEAANLRDGRVNLSNK
jgi:GDPmannose 4,6-dehydratase